MKADFLDGDKLVLFPENNIERLACTALELEAADNGGYVFAPLAISDEAAPAPVEAAAAPEPEPVAEPEPAAPAEDAAPDRDAIKAKLDALGVEYRKTARTPTLVKLLEAAEAGPAPEAPAEAKPEAEAAAPAEDKGIQFVPSVDELTAEARAWIGTDKDKVPVVTAKINELGGAKISELTDEGRQQLQAFLREDSEGADIFA
jgi:hypothetical protein